MNSTQIVNLYNKLTQIPKMADTEDNCWSDKHMMTNKELIYQTEWYVQAVYTAFNPDVPATIHVQSIPKNGVTFTVRYINDMKKGYTGSVYAVAGKNNIILKIIDIFQKGSTALQWD